MITIAAREFGPGAVLQVRELPSENGYTIERRVTKAKTLDGGVAVNDGGFSHADLTRPIAWTPRNASELDAARDLLETHDRVTVAMPEGVYLAAPVSLSIDATTATLELAYIARLSG